MMRRQKRTLYTHLKYGLKRSGAYKKETQKKKRRKGYITEESQTAVHGIDLMDQIMCISLAGLYGSLCYAGGINIWAK
jgi:hypothetical protein